MTVERQPNTPDIAGLTAARHWGVGELAAHIQDFSYDPKLGSNTTAFGRLSRVPTSRDIAPVAQLPFSVTPAGRHRWVEYPRPARVRLDSRRHLRDPRPGIVESNQREAGRVVGSYQLFDMLGSGAMGEVHRARHAASGVDVAIKTPKTSSRLALEAIRREVHTLTRISHPGVVRLIEHGVQDGRPWYAMDLLEGETLRKFKDRVWQAYHRPVAPAHSTVTRTVTESVPSLGETAEPDPPHGSPHPFAGAHPPRAGAGQLPRIIAVVRHLCHTLAFLHGEGFVSCDLKPENLMLVEGEPVIIDFGLAAQHPGGSSREGMLSQQGIAGTLPYMSPEQIRGELVDARSDLYSLGCLLYELAAGRPPFVEADKPILLQHLEDSPVSLGDLVTEAPPLLDELLKKLLSKEPAERFGYADEVAAALGRLLGEFDPVSHRRTIPSYLCRPRFIDRAGLFSTIAELTADAARGSGALVLLGGESGSGKTRLALELARLARQSRMQVVTSEASMLSLETHARVAAAPLNALRPLLQTIADRCLQGPDITERLLGHRRALLATYEPLLRDVPSLDGPAPVVQLGAEASRQRFFKYLAETLAALASLRPLVWLLDDAGWADEFSLSFLRSLSAEFLERTPLLILCCYRNDEMSASLSALLEHPSARNSMLPRLDRSALGAMVADILAMPRPPEDFVSFLADHAEGNPFFLAEYLRAAVSQKVLVRDDGHSWQLSGSSNGLGYSALPLPLSLRALLEHRFEQLSARARELAIAGAVLGREFDRELLGEVFEPGVGSEDAQLSELVHRQVLEHASGHRLRFAHDKLREVAYSQAPESLLQSLHLRAGEAIEASGNAQQFLSALGHHFALARVPAKAATYFTKAADQARDAHANADAIELYRKALNELGTEGNDPSRLEVNQALGDVLALGGQRLPARAAYEAALELASNLPQLAKAQLYRRLGKTWETVHPHDQALRIYQLARDTLGDAPEVDSHEWLDEWVLIRSSQAFANYWLGDLPALERQVAELETVVSPSASPWQRVRLHRAQLQLCFRKDRYVLDQQGVEYARAALNDCLACGDLGELPLAHFLLAFSLFLHGEFESADWELRSASAIAERTGDIISHARCLTYLTTNARLRGRPDDAKQYLPLARSVASTASMREYYGVVCANEAWLAWREGDAEGAARLAEEALGAWKELAFCYAFQWTALWVLLDLHADAREYDRAAAVATALIDTTQQRLPAAVADALTASLAAHSHGNSREQREELERARTLARLHHFL